MKKYEKALIYLLCMIISFQTIGTSGFQIAMVCQFLLLVILCIGGKNEESR